MSKVEKEKNGQILANCNSITTQCPKLTLYANEWGMGPIKRDMNVFKGDF